MEPTPPPPAGPPPGESLDSLAAEAATAVPAELVPAAPPPPPIPPADEGLVFGCQTIIRVLGSIITERAGVARLSDDETERLGKAAADVARFYLPADATDPRLMAWVGLFLAVGSVAAPRLSKPVPDADASGQR